MKLVRLGSFFGLIIFVMACESTNKNSDNEFVQNPFQKYESLKVGQVELFYPEEVSTLIDGFNTSFSTDLTTMYYTVTSQKLGITGIVSQQFVDGRFREAEFVPFATAEVPTADVRISPDGRQLYFSTFMDYEGKPDGFQFNIWRSTLVDGVWSEPEALDSTINSTGNEFYPVFTQQNRMYFNSDRSGNSDIYFSDFVDGKYQAPIRLPSNINSDGLEADAFVSPDDSVLIFVRYDEPEGYGKSDLYISFREGDNQWTDPVNMGDEINTEFIDGSPYLTVDKQFLVFTSDRFDDVDKASAFLSFRNFEEMMTSHKNGSLNHVITRIDVNKYT